ncbi:MAG: hypothetical protein ACJASY_002482 [Halioglobus sp.]|jgi:hypothetical protein
MQSFRGQRGQIVALTMFLAIPAALVLAYILNGGAIAFRKTELQNATDTAAFTQAAWVARSLNVMSMNNTAMTQSFVISNAAWAMEGPLFFAGYEAGEVAGYYLGSIGRVAKLTGKWGAALAVVLYTFLYAMLNEHVLNPLYDFYEELSKAINDRELNGGLARAAMGFGKMNTLLVSEGPKAMVDYNEKMAEANGLDGKLNQYVGWTQSATVELPVVKQSFEDGFKALKDMNNFSVANVLKSTDSLRNILNIRSSGESGAYKSVVNPELDYFSNFDQHGFAKDTGPRDATFNTVETEFTKVRTELDKFADGSWVSDQIAGLLRSLLPGCDGFLSFICDPILSLLEDLFNAIFGVLLDTKTDVTPNDMKERLEKVWDWSTLYRDAPYTTIPTPLAGTLDVWITTLAAPPRFVLGLPYGTYRGYKGKSGRADKGDTKVDDGKAKEAAKELEAKLEMEKRLNKIYDDCITIEEKKVNDEYNGLEKKNQDSSLSDIDKQAEASRLAGQRAQELIQARATCQARRDAQKKSAEKELASKQGEGINPNDLPSDSGDDREGSLGSSGDKDIAASSPNRNLLLWWYEAAYRFGMKNMLPVTEVANKIPNIDFLGFRGLFNSFEVDLYAVKDARITPDAASSLLNTGFGIDTSGVLFDRKDWSMVYLATSDVGVPILSSGFKNVKGNFVTLAQAEVYNTQWFDLYTQNWRAKMTPLSVLSSKRHRAKVHDAFKGENDVLSAILNPNGPINEKQLEAITAH